MFVADLGRAFTLLYVHRFIWSFPHPDEVDPPSSLTKRPRVREAISVLSWRATEAVYGEARFPVPALGMLSGLKMGKEDLK